MLIEHRIHDVYEGLVTVEQPVPSREQVALEPPLALMLAQLLHDPPVARQELIAPRGLGYPLAIGRLEHRFQTIRESLVGPKNTKVPRRRIQLRHVSQEL